MSFTLCVCAGVYNQVKCLEVNIDEVGYHGPILYYLKSIRLLFKENRGAR